jgi:uncharacterized iron-regulated membrane protein
MRNLLQKIHMYLGLLCWSILFVYGIAGLTATVFRSGPPGPHLQSSTLRTESFVPPPNQTDRQVADAVWRKLQIPLTGPPPAYAIHRDRQNNLAVNFYTANGPTFVTVLEQQNQLRIETRRNTLWAYFNNLHSTTLRGHPYDWRVRLWTYYNEFAVWALLAMGLTGVFLWLSSRPRHLLAQAAVAVAWVSFLVLYVVTR